MRLSTYMGFYASVNGTYNLSGAASTSFTTSILDVGYSGIGKFTQAGGTLTATSGIVVATLPGSSGTYFNPAVTPARQVLLSIPTAYTTYLGAP